MELSAQVYTKTEKGVYYVKVFLSQFDMYISSITVRPSTKHPEKGLWIQMPAIPYKGHFIRPVEFRPGSQLKVQIEDEVLRAVDQYNREEKLAEDDDWVPKAGKEDI